MKRPAYLLTAVLLCLFFPPVYAAPSDSATHSETALRIDALVQSYADRSLFNGSMLVARNGEVIVKKGYGMANFEWEIPNTPDTRFRLGSLTKQFTSMVILQLVDEGKLALEDKLSDRLPYYRKDTGSKVTIHQLLNHTSGIPNYTDIADVLKHGRETLSTRDLVTAWCSRDLEFEPGTKFVYSNSGYVILGALVEEVTGKKYEQVVKEGIFEPLGMKASGYDHYESVISRRATGYDNRLDSIRHAEFVDMSLPHAAGALYSTVEDLLLWDQALYGAKLLSDAGKMKIFTPGQGSYGYGWYIMKAPAGPDKAERQFFRHMGAIFGFSSLILRVPQERILIVLLNNTGGAPLSQISQGIGDILYGREPQVPRQSIARALYKTASEKGAEAAIAQFRDIKAKNAAEYDLGQGEINQLGYALLGTGRVDDAISIFNLNVEAFPGSWKVYDSLAEGYAAKGQKALAIKNYAHSIELNPENTNGIKKLQELVAK